VLGKAFFILKSYKQQTMKKVDYITKNFSMVTDTISDIIDIPKGKIIRVAIFNSEAPTKEVDILLKDHSNNTIVPATNYKDWKDGSGEYLERKKPVSIKGGNYVKLIANSEVAQTTPFNFQVLFVVDQSEIE